MARSLTQDSVAARTFSARWCRAVALALLLCACSEREEPSFDAQLRRADCLAQVAEFEAAAIAAEARALEALHGVSSEAAEVIRRAHHALTTSNRRTAEIIRGACGSGAR